MHGEWPVLEFPELHSNILDLFSNETAESVAHDILAELARPGTSATVENGSNGHGSKELVPAVRLHSEEHLRWVMQVLNHSLTLPLAGDRAFSTIGTAVSLYTHWLRALTTEAPDGAIPAPLLHTPEKYFRGIIDALRFVFIRRVAGGSGSGGPLLVERQAMLIEHVLDSVKLITATASRKYQDEVCSRMLSFMLNSADILLAPPVFPEDVSTRVGSSVIESLLSLWLRAAVDEQIPSPTYWKTLGVLTGRWKHHVRVVESWAQKLLALSVIVVQRMYGPRYCAIPIADEALESFAARSENLSSSDPGDSDEGARLLYECWLNILELLPSPAGILNHNPAANTGLYGVDPQSSEVPLASDAAPLCFFLAVTAMQRMVDIFYGDPRVRIDMNECDAYRRHLEEERDENTTEGVRSAFSSAIPTPATTAVPSRSNSDMKAHRTKARLSDRSMKGIATSYSGDSSTAEQAGAAYRRATSLSSSGGEATGGYMAGTDRAIEKAGRRRPAMLSASRVVAYSLSGSSGQIPFVPEAPPRSEKLLNLSMDWLLQAASATYSSPPPQTYTDGRRNTDDVISSLSLCSVDTEELSAMAGHEKTATATAHPTHQQTHQAHYAADEQRRSYGGSVSSSSSGVPPPSPGASSAISSVDGVEAGRAAAVAALTRVVCAKQTTERLPDEQLAQYLAMLHDALVQKERLVLCSTLFYGHSLFSLSLPGVEALLPHFLFAIDLVLVESFKLRLHPSVEETEMRRSCLRSLATVVCWPTTFGLSLIPQLPESTSLKSSAVTYLQLRLRIFKALIFSLRHETDPVNLQLTLSMCSILCETSASYDLSMDEKQRREAARLGAFPAAGPNGTGEANPEKGSCASIVRGVVSAVCDRLCRPEWSSEFSVSLAAIDLLNALSSIHPSILFTSKDDLSTGSLIVSSLCRFIETQLMKPPPAHSKDLHSSVVGAYQSLVVWLRASPALAACEGVLCTVADAIQLGITGSKEGAAGGDRKAASKRVFDAAECLMCSLFTLVGREEPWRIVDERRLLYQFGPSLIDSTRFRHFLVNRDTLLSIHEASHITALSKGSACVIYVRRSPMHPATAGFARLRGPLSDVEPGDGSGEESAHPSQPSEATPVTSGTPSTVSPSASSAPSNSAEKKSLAASSASPSTLPSPSHSTSTATAGATTLELARAFQIPPDFHKATCKLDATWKPLESTRESEAILGEMQKAASHPEIPNVAWLRLPERDRKPQPKQPGKTCDSIRVFLYDFGLLDKQGFGCDLVPLDAGQSSDFYHDLHEMVDTAPAFSSHTAFIFYVKDGQRSPVDILENGMAIQSTSAEFCSVLGSLGEGIEIGVHEGWTGHWATAYSQERKPQEGRSPVDHYVLDGITHALYSAEGGCELAFVMPTTRSLKFFKQEMSSPSRASTLSKVLERSESVSTARGSENAAESTDEVFSPASGRGSNVHAYSGGGSSMGNAPPQRRSSSELRVLLVWLERLEDLHHFPLEDVLCACDDGGDRAQAATSSSSSSASRSAQHIAIFMYLVEPGLVMIRTRGSTTRFGAAGPLLDGVVVSLSSLPTLFRLTLLNITRRSVAEVDNYQLTHVKRRSAIDSFAKKYRLGVQYNEYLLKLMLN